MDCFDVYSSSATMKKNDEVKIMSLYIIKGWGMWPAVVESLKAADES